MWEIYMFAWLHNHSSDTFSAFSLPLCAAHISSICTVRPPPSCRVSINRKSFRYSALTYGLILCSVVALISLNTSKGQNRVHFLSCGQSETWPETDSGFASWENIETSESKISSCRHGLTLTWQKHTRSPSVVFFFPPSPVLACWDRPCSTWCWFSHQCVWAQLSWIQMYMHTLPWRGVWEVKTRRRVIDTTGPWQRWSQWLLWGLKLPSFIG